MNQSLKLFASALLATVALPAIAAAQDARVTVDVNMRAGPSTEFPVVVTVPEAYRVTVYGCVDDYEWCDVDWRGRRGWVYADYIDYLYEGRYVPVMRYASRIDLPIVTFSLNSYWADYYRDEPWYDERARWRFVWRERRDRDRFGRLDDDDDVRIRSRIERGDDDEVRTRTRVRRGDDDDDDRDRTRVRRGDDDDDDRDRTTVRRGDDDDDRDRTRVRRGDDDDDDRDRTRARRGDDDDVRTRGRMGRAAPDDDAGAPRWMRRGGADDEVRPERGRMGRVGEDRARGGDQDAGARRRGGPDAGPSGGDDEPRRPRRQSQRQEEPGPSY
jgi:uncharacterized protein YraI